MKRKSGERTLLASVVLSAPGPVVLGVGLLVGRSSTQLADFVRRTAELAAIVVSWAMYRKTNQDSEKDPMDKAKRKRIANASVGIAMCLGGAAMVLIALLSNVADKGNVIPGLIIAVLGLLTNSWFWLRYRKLHRLEANAILAVQSKLYRAKSLVDGCVAAALTAVAISPTSPAAHYMDIGGSVVVAVYLIVNGMATLLDRKERPVFGAQEL